MYQTFIVRICVVKEAASIHTTNARKRLTWRQISWRETLSLPTRTGSRDVVRIDGCTNQTTQCRKTEYPQPSKRQISMNSGVRIMIFFAPCGLLHNLRWLESSARKAQAFSSWKLTLLWDDTVMVLWRTKFVKWMWDNCSNTHFIMFLSGVRCFTVCTFPIQSRWLKSLKFTRRWKHHCRSVLLQMKTKPSHKTLTRALQPIN
jgi:hypothetical protein